MSRAIWYVKRWFAAIVHLVSDAVGVATLGFWWPSWGLWASIKWLPIRRTPTNPQESPDE